MRTHHARTMGVLVAAALGAVTPAQALQGQGAGGGGAARAVLDGTALAQMDGQGGGIFGGDPSDESDGDRRALVEKAAELCTDYARERVRDEGGDEVRIERIVDSEVDGDDAVQLVADVSARYPSGVRSARVECAVNLEGDDEVTAFRQTGEAGGGGLGGILGGILGGGAAGGFGQEEDSALVEKAAGLCAEYAREQVRDEGGDEVRIERIVDSRTEGDDRVELVAEMSARYPSGVRSARIECAVDLEGDDEVTAFRQTGEAGGNALDDLLGGILGGGASSGVGDSDERSANLTEEAQELCLDYALERVRDGGGNNVRIERVLDSDVDGDRVTLEAEMSARYPGGSLREARIECEVDFEGDNEVVAFRQR